jgi:hypothetical protein
MKATQARIGSRRGQGLVEYLIIIAAILALVVFIGPRIGARVGVLYNGTGDKVNEASDVVNASDMHDALDW